MWRADNQWSLCGDQCSVFGVLGVRCSVLGARYWVPRSGDSHVMMSVTRGRVSRDGARLPMGSGLVFYRFYSKFIERNALRCEVRCGALERVTAG